MAELVPGAELLVEGTGALRRGTLIVATDDVLRLRDARNSEPVEIAWASVRRISVRSGAPRSWAAPIVLGVIGGGLLGSCSALLFGGGATFPPRSSDNSIVTSATLIGTLVGVLLGCLIVFARRGPSWEVVFELPPNAQPLVAASLSARMEQGAAIAAQRVATADTRKGVETALAYGLLIVFVAGFCAWFRTILVSAP